MFPASQAHLPTEKQRLCDNKSNLGCFGWCAYDPASATPLTVVESAVDLNPDLICNSEVGGGKPCGTDAMCDDQNPCTADKCGGPAEIEFKTCHYTVLDNVPCDDGLFCDGNATNGDGCSSACAVEIGFKCLGSPSVCAPLPPTVTPTSTPTPTPRPMVVPVIPSPGAPLGLLWIGAMAALGLSLL